jgi:pimeloyl-ACP methyl ester carboxylesterase
MNELRSDRRFQAGDMASDAEYYRIHFGTTLRNPDHLDAVVRRLRLAFTEDGIVTARAIEDMLYEDTWARDEYDLIPTPRRLDIPTLVISGDDDFVPREVVAHIADAIPGSRLEVLADCGHFVYLEHPEETDTIIAAFMTSP